MVLFGFKNPGGNTQQPPADPIYTPSPILLRKILGFQTITTILSQIKPQAPTEPNNDRYDTTPTPEVQKELELCAAFAHLAVFQHEVVALATNLSDSQLKIVCTSTSAEHKDAPPNDNPKTSTSFLGRCLRFCYARNTRFEEAGSTPKYPYIIEAKAPVGYQENVVRSKTLHKYLDDLEEKW